MARPTKTLAKVVHLYAGLDLIASKTSVSNRECDLEVTSIGVKAISKKTKRIVLIPWTNIKGAELIPGASEEE